MRVLNAKLNVDAKKSKTGGTYFVYSVAILDKVGKPVILAPLPMDVFNQVNAKQIRDLALSDGVHEEVKETEVDITKW